MEIVLNFVHYTFRAEVSDEWWCNMYVSYHLGDLGINVRIILKLILNMFFVIWIPMAWNAVLWQAAVNMAMNRQVV